MTLARDKDAVGMLQKDGLRGYALATRTPPDKVYRFTSTLTEGLRVLGFGAVST